MSIEALWSITFASQTGQLLNAGNGIVVLETSRIFGGDSGYIYVGNYRHNVKTDLIEASLKVSKYGNTGMQSVFGPMNNFHLELQGKFDNKTFRLDGHVKEKPELRLVVAGIRRAELP